MKTSAIIVAGGSSTRFGGEIPKQYLKVCGRPLLSWTISRFEKATSIDDVIVVVAEDYLLYVGEHVIDPFGFQKVSKIVIGGETRRESVLRGLEALSPTTNFVAIHDGARAVTKPDDIEAVVVMAQKERAVMLAAPITDTVKRVKDSYVIASLDRANLYGAQTPQVFQYDLILNAHRELEGESDLGWVTDDASIIERKGFKVRIVEPTGPNLKVTGKDDIKKVELLLKEEENELP